MLLSELESLPLRKYIEKIYQLLVDIINGAIPVLEYFTDHEMKKLLRGEDLEDINTPFVGLKLDMVVARLPSMELKTTRDVYFRKRQMKLLSFFETINKMLAILQLESLRLDAEESLLASRMY